MDLGQRQDATTRAAGAQRATWVSVAVNLALTVAQLVVGWIAHSQSLIAHGLHSFSDLLSDFLVLYASRQGAHPADRDHPYGHARYETAATLILGVSLLLIGAGILWESGLRMQHIDALPTLALPAFWVALATVIVKEGLYRYLLRVAEQLRSQLLLANALHTRADAASALVVVVGIGGALLGGSFLDLLAAALMGFMILRMGGGLALGALRELIDTGLDAAQVEAIQTTLLQTPGVRGLHRLRTRRMADQILADAHVQVDSRISVTEGHRIAEAARRAVLAAHPGVLDMLVHVDPDEDMDDSPRFGTLPTREMLLEEIQPLIADLPKPCRIELHYLNGKVEVDLFIGHQYFSNLETLKRLQCELDHQVCAHPYLRRITANTNMHQ